MTILNPTYLWAFLGVLVPIAIHLWSRKKVVTIKVGSTKLLTASEPRQTSSIRPNEWWLLALRIVTIVLLTLILSGLHFKKDIQKMNLAYVIEPSLLSSLKIQGLIDSLSPESVRVLTHGFSEVEDFDFATGKASVPGYWQLAQELATLPADSIIVLTKGTVSGLLGMRPTSRNNVNWIVLNDSEEESNTLLSVSKKGDSAEVLSLSSNSKSLLFEKEMISLESDEIKTSAIFDSIQIGQKLLPLNLQKPTKVGIVHADSLTREMDYISAVFRAISKYLDEPIEVIVSKTLDSVDQETFDMSIWLGKEVVPNKETNHLIFRPDVLAVDLIMPGKAKNEFYLTDRLNSENVIYEHLAESLLGLLNRHGDLSESIERYDKRVLDVKELRPILSEKVSKQTYAKLLDISPWLWGMLFLILACERVLAQFRKQ